MRRDWIAQLNYICAALKNKAMKLQTSHRSPFSWRIFENFCPTIYASCRLVWLSPMIPSVELVLGLKDASRWVLVNLKVLNIGKSTQNIIYVQETTFYIYWRIDERTPYSDSVSRRLSITRVDNFGIWKLHGKFFNSYWMLTSLITRKFQIVCISKVPHRAQDVLIDLLTRLYL